MTTQRTYAIQKLDIPPLLTEIPDPPKQLNVRGTFPGLKNKYVAVVGSRTYTQYGKTACEKLISGLAGYPVVIVSGLALGIDGIAHRAALRAGLKTVAVPGSGLDDSVIYPRTHFSLAQDILESGGALLSEFDPKWKPRPESFPQRNRIMAGMSHAVLVIEAEERSGTLITSRLATEYNRDVCAVPGPIHSATSAGPHMLIHKGATLIRDSTDLLDVLDIEKEYKINVPNETLSKDEKKVYTLLKEPLSRDELIRALDMPTSDANMLLSALEIKGCITEQLGVVIWQ